MRARSASSSAPAVRESQRYRNPEVRARRGGPLPATVGRDFGPMTPGERAQQLRAEKRGSVRIRNRNRHGVIVDPRVGPQPANADAGYVDVSPSFRRLIGDDLLGAPNLVLETGPAPARTRPEHDKVFSERND